jgi:hypothetical protein
MAEFKRGLSEDCTSALQRLARERDGNWWKEVLANKDLLLAVRGRYLNAYVKGQSVFKIGPGVDRGKPRVEIHYKYLVEPEMEEGTPYVQFDGEKFSVDPAKVIQTRYKLGVTLERLVRTAVRFSGAEKAGLHRIAAKERKVVDVEIAFTRSGDAGEKSTAPRMDLAVLIPWRSKGARLVFCEAKCADNVEIWKPAEKKNDQDEPRIAVVNQIAKYEKFIGDTQNTESLVDAYVRVCKTLIDLRQQGLNRKPDPLVEAVATKQIPLTIHPKVYLLVYGFDAQKKKSTVKELLERLRARDMLGHRVIAKGDPGSFSLSNDILHCEKAAGE